MLNVIEKRKYPRVIINAGVTYTRSSDNGQYAGFCKNLSHTGILFVTEQLLSAGDSVVITLDTKSSSFTPLKARIEIYPCFHFPLISFSQYRQKNLDYFS